jgi:hypothetical protein
LIEARATIVVTQLPIESIERLGEARFQIFRRLFFPKCTLTLNAVRESANVLNEQLVSFGQARKVPVISVSGAWYGFDPIHLKRRARWRAWPDLLAAWLEHDETLRASGASVWLSAYLNCLAPREHTIFGIRRGCAQPSGRLADGTTVSLY